MKDPLNVNITDLHGNPVASAGVSFIITGGGSASPAEIATDASGGASTVITLGNNQGTYVVLISSGSSQVSLTINATNIVGGQ